MSLRLQASLSYTMTKNMKMDYFTLMLALESELLFDIPATEERPHAEASEKGDISSFTQQNVCNE